MRQRVWHYRDTEAYATAVPAGEADAVDGDRSLFHHLDGVAVGADKGESFTVAFGTTLQKSADSVDMTTDEMTSKAVAKRQGTFEVELLPAAPTRQRGFSPGFRAGMKLRQSSRQFGNGQADTVGRNTVAQLGARGQMT